MSTGFTVFLQYLSELKEILPLKWTPAFLWGQPLTLALCLLGLSGWHGPSVTTEDSVLWVRHNCPRLLRTRSILSGCCTSFKAL